MASKRRSRRRGAELHAAGLIWEGSDAEFSAIIWDAKAEAESTWSMGEDYGPYAYPPGHVYRQGKV